MASSKPRVTGKQVQTASMRAVPESVDGLAQQVFLRPDGYYWQAPDGRQEFGPFKTIEDAVADMQTADEEAPEPGESLREAESELGLADWIDPETGDLAEGHRPRLED